MCFVYINMISNCLEVCLYLPNQIQIIQCHKRIRDKDSTKIVLLWCSLNSRLWLSTMFGVIENGIYYKSIKPIWIEWKQTHTHRNTSALWYENISPLNKMVINDVYIPSVSKSFLFLQQIRPFSCAIFNSFSLAGCCVCTVQLTVC